MNKKTKRIILTIAWLITIVGAMRAIWIYPWFPSYTDICFMDTSTWECTNVPAWIAAAWLILVGYFTYKEYKK